MGSSRLDRQLRIEGWNQHTLEKATIGVVGDNDLLASLYSMSASALGINHVVILAPFLDPLLARIAQKLNSRFTLTHLEGFYVHPVMDDLFKSCSLIVDLSHCGLSNKLLLEKGYREELPVIRGYCYEDSIQQGFKIFTYVRGREWRALEQMVSPQNLPADHFDDGVLSMIVAGIALEESKNILMAQEVSDDVIRYERQKLKTSTAQPNILVTGSGALGIFVGLGLAYSGFQNITFMDPDIVEVTNLNRQVLFYDAIGRSKAETLAERLNSLFHMETKAQVSYFDSDTDIESYDVIFDCVDNFESRIVLSEKSKNHATMLISGGTGVDAGQVVIYNPTMNSVTPAELLGLYDIVEKRSTEAYERQRAACVYQPDPSLIMTNQIAAGFMVDAYRMILTGQEPRNIFYNSLSKARIWADRRDSK